LSEILFDEDKLNLPHKKKTKSGYSTNAEVLESLRDKHPIINVILEYRALAKLKSTYCEGLLKVIDNDGRIHSTLNQTETRTGRISSTEPNLQNIPVRKEIGREMRKFFVAKEGSLLADADYSQIELRLLAHMSDDEIFVNAFKTGEDIHTKTASNVFGVPESEVTKDMRRMAKVVNFGIIYGISEYGLADDLKIKAFEARKLIENFYSSHKAVGDFMKNAIEKARETGIAETLFGRKRKHG
jgi:DNA polymerase-1